MSKSVYPSDSLFSTLDSIPDEDTGNRGVRVVADRVGVPDEPKLLQSMTLQARSTLSVKPNRSRPSFQYVQPKNILGLTSSTCSGPFEEASPLASLFERRGRRVYKISCKKSENPSKSTELTEGKITPALDSPTLSEENKPEGLNRAAILKSLLSMNNLSPPPSLPPVHPLANILMEDLKEPMTVDISILQTVCRSPSHSTAPRCILKRPMNSVSAACSPQMISMDKKSVSSFSSPVNVSSSNKRVSFSKNMIVIQYKNTR